MADASRHPELGMTFVHVVPSDWGPCVDVRACLQSLARRRPWVMVITPSEYQARMNDWLWNDPDTLFILWTLHDPGPKYQRKCKVAFVYSEALDIDGDKLLPAHLDFWHTFKTMAVHLDAVFTHTPMTRDIVARAGLPAFVLPVGWDGEAMGLPRWDAPKHQNLLYHGSCVGRRVMIIPYLKTALVKEFTDVTGHYGRALLGALDTAYASLYIAHSEVSSFSTWRLWQTASTSAAMVAEPGDTWPFEPGRDLITIPRLTMDNAPQSATDLAYMVKHDRDRFIEVASRAHEVALRYTVDAVHERYLVPAAAELQGVKAS